MAEVVAEIHETAGTLAYNYFFNNYIYQLFIKLYFLYNKLVAKLVFPAAGVRKPYILREMRQP